MGFVPISLCFAVLNVCTGVGSSTAQRFALNPNGIFNSLISAEQFSAISGDTHALIKPIQLLLLYFVKTLEIVSLEGNKLFFLI